MRADLSHGEAPDLGSQMNQAETLGVPVVVVLRVTSLEPGGKVLIKQLRSREDFKVPSEPKY